MCVYGNTYEKILSRNFHAPAPSTYPAPGGRTVNYNGLLLMLYVYLLTKRTFLDRSNIQLFMS